MSMKVTKEQFIGVTYEELLAENAKLRGARDVWQENDAKLRELVRDMWHDGMCECDERGACAECEYHYTDRMRELGIEVDG
jgi:hypothetical protein